MTAQDNIDLVRQFIDDVWNNQNAENARQYLADDYVEHNPMGDFEGIDEFGTFLEMTLEAFPDNQIDIQETTGDGQMVAFHYMIQGTHKGNLGPLEPTNQKVKLDACFICRIKDGKIEESWYVFDQLSLNVQLGVIELPDYIQEMQEQMRTAGEQTEGEGPTTDRPRA